ncbi:suppressor APC domain-containing protein 1-like isoform X1 [Nerophis lumbriciformis]|uniref:suppressor APC domain-containing protein 1-like isoform X1 n=1 Tax=Nerophis lumbriciformis TaxID=546530 RepID=UPI003BAA0D9B
MACPPAAAASSCSYTVVIIPLKSRLYGLDALRFYLWIKRLKDLEKEKDALCCGLEILDKARCWYRQRLDENRAWKETKSGVNSCREGAEKDRSCLLRSRIERVNASLGSVMTGSCESRTSSHSLLAERADSALRWQHAVLTQAPWMSGAQFGDPKELRPVALGEAPFGIRLYDSRPDGRPPVSEKMLNQVSVGIFMPNDVVLVLGESPS